MKAYGVDLKDLGRDCTSTGKYGSSKLVNKCSCGKTECYTSVARKSKTRKKKARRKLNNND